MIPEVFKAHGLVWVRETQVQITPQAINAYLGTHDVPECVHSGGLPVNLVDQFWTLNDALVASLRRDGQAIGGPEDAILQHGELHPEMAFWTIFLNYHLIASHHRTNVSVDTAKVLYAIQHNRQFDVGRIIFNQILNIGQANIAAAFDDRYLIEPQQELKKKAYNHFCTHHRLPNLPTEGGRYRNRGIRGRGEQGAAAELQQEAGR